MTSGASIALPQGNDMRTRQLRLKATTAGRVLGALGLFAAVFAVTGSPASAAAAPRNLADIDVTFTGSNGDYVVAALTKSGTVSVEVVSCEGDICQKHGWTNLSGALTSIAIKTARSGDVVLLGRSSSGRTWYRRGECSNHACSWSGWSGLGGNLRSVRSAESNSYGCINVADPDLRVGRRFQHQRRIDAAEAGHGHGHRDRGDLHRGAARRRAAARATRLGDHRDLEIGA